jgi:hypothetical protein
VTSKPRPRWLVPIGSATATITIDDGFATPAVLLEIPPGQIGGPAHTLTPLEACQLGMALQDASAVSDVRGLMDR